MATTKRLVLHDNVIGGVDTTSPAHLIGLDKWRTQHNMRFTPTLQQTPRKFVAALSDTLSLTKPVMWIGLLPTATAGRGKLVFLTANGLYTIDGAKHATLIDDGAYHRWSTALYDGRLYYTNDINQVHVFDGNTDFIVGGSLSGRYVTFWYDHLVIGALAGFSDRVAISDLYNFSVWQPDRTNEADYYDLVEWQQTDNSFTGVTGLGKLHGVLWVYTPTAIVPFTYVGLPKVIQLNEQGVLTRIGNTFPWTLVTLDIVHFFYDAMESMFFAFDGQAVEAIGEPVRKFMQDNLSTDLTQFTLMWGYVDTNNREVWWLFVSAVSSGGIYDKAVVFNYRYKRWFTASVENYHSFCGSSQSATEIKDLTGTIGALSGTIRQLSLNTNVTGRIYGAGSGQILQDELSSTPTDSLLPYDNPVLETGDYHYGDIRTVKENDAMVINAAVNDGVTIQINVAARTFLGEKAIYGNNPTSTWSPKLQDALCTYAPPSGRILRYKFVLKDARMCTFDAFSDAVYAKTAEK